MTKEELSALLRDPNQTGQTVDELNRIVEENLYFHTGHQLYIKGLQQTDEKKMALQLNKTALSVRDRGVLYNYINRPSVFRQQPLPGDNPKETSAPFVPDDSHIAPEADIPEPILPQENSLSVPEEEQNTVAGEKALSDDQLMDLIRCQLNHIAPSSSGKEEIVACEEKKESSSDNCLIDTFLKSNPKIVPDENNYHVDLSESLQENLDIATDTLAEIYAAQGHISKAIEIYEHLILKYPEKHIYFAAQIERLKS